MGISRTWRTAASALAVAALTQGCGRATAAGTNPAAPLPVTVSKLRLSQVYVLESGGVPPADTSVTIQPGQHRVVILRHEPPDNSDFVQLDFPATTFKTAEVPVRVTVRPLPGIYGVTVESSAPIGPDATITFKYPVHFTAPAEALKRFGGAGMFERMLNIGRDTGGGLYGFVDSTRPASDNLSAPLPSAGAYIVAAPR